MDPLRAAGDAPDGRTLYPTPTQAARGVLASPETMAELMRLLALLEPAAMDALCAAWAEAKAGARSRLERYRTTPASEWGPA